MTALPVLETWAATTLGGTPGTSISLTKPSGVVAGDLLVMIVGNDDINSSDVFQAVTGWNKVDEVGNGTSDAHVAVYWRKADGTEGASQTVNMDNSVDAYGWYLRISGANVNNPIHVAGAGFITVGASHAIPSITTTIPNCLVFYALAFDGGDGTPFSVSGTGWAEIDEENAGSGSNEASGCFGSKAQATAGATGIATVTSNRPDGSASLQFAIGPAVEALGGAMMVSP